MLEIQKNTDNKSADFITIDRQIKPTSKIKKQENINSYSKGKEPITFADIYQENINIVTWQRNLSKSLKISINEILNANLNFEENFIVSSTSVSSSLQQISALTDYSELIEDISEIVDIFCFLLDTPKVGLRLNALDRAMCPKFHVDRIPCRLVTTYHGIATEWLPNKLVDRSKLGLGSKGLSDDKSGLYQHGDDIQRLNCGDVSILKGETWINNENAGLIHRSPSLSPGEKRLLLTLDYFD